MDDIRQALESMVWQFAHRTTTAGKIALTTGGLSALEEAFVALGLEDPHFIDAKHYMGLVCDIEGCNEWSTSGLHWGDLYLSLCRDHTKACFRDSNSAELRPPMKRYAILRESLRDEKRSLPIDWPERVQALLEEEAKNATP